MTENIEFNEEKQYKNDVGFQEKNSFFAQLLINLGLVKDGKSANIFLIGIAIVFFVISIYLFLKVLGFVG